MFYCNNIILTFLVAIKVKSRIKYNFILEYSWLLLYIYTYLNLLQYFHRRKETLNSILLNISEHWFKSSTSNISARPHTFIHRFRSRTSSKMIRFTKALQIYAVLEYICQWRDYHWFAVGEFAGASTTEA